MADTRRVLFVQACAEIGGTELQTFELARWLRPRGFEVHTLFDCAPGPMVERYEREGLPFLVRQDGLWPSAALRKWVRDVDPRAALLHGLAVNVKWRFWLRLFFPSVRRWGANRGLTNSDHVPWYRIAIDRATVPLLHGYVSNSTFIIEYLVQRGFPRAKMFHLKNFVRLEEHLETHGPLPGVVIPSGIPVITYVANARPVKGHALLLRALAEVKKAGVPFTCLLVGDLSSDPTIPEHVHALGLEDVVICTGMRSDVDDILAKSDVFVFPSLMEGCPNAVLEAMRAGLPVVSSPWGDQGWLIEEGRGGFVVDPQDAKEFAGRIGALLGDPERRQRFGRHNRERLRAAFDPQDVARVALDLQAQMTG